MRLGFLTPQDHSLLRTSCDALPDAQHLSELPWRVFGWEQIPLLGREVVDLGSSSSWGRFCFNPCLPRCRGE